MRNLGQILTAVTAVHQLSHARVIHLDVPGGADVAIDVELNHGPALQKPDSAEVTAESSAFASNYDVDLGYEKHRGFEYSSGFYLNFSNIPYAAPPTGELRWRYPKKPEKTIDEVNEGRESMMCSQYAAGWFPKAVEFLTDYGEAAKGKFSFEDHWRDEIDLGDYKEFDYANITGSEDCLVLDVHVPKYVWANREENKVPVVVFIHGGGYTVGWKEQAGEPLPLFEAADKNKAGDFIYVAINYRLGLFGFLGGDKFIRDGGVPNVGFHDQHFALEWVQKNIGLFGGDKDAVTVMGQSAGASSILHHITSYGGNASYKPPFKRAILESPAFFPEGDPYTTQGAYDEILIRAQKRNVDGLRQVFWPTLLLANSLMDYYVPYGLFKFGPSVDYKFVPELPGQLLAKGTYHKDIEVILGHTSLDGLLFTPPWLRSDSGLEDYLYRLYPPMTEENMTTIHNASFYKIYPKEAEIYKIDAVRDLLDDVAISCNNHYLTKAMLKDGSKSIYRFLFARNPAIHGADLPYVFYPSPYHDYEKLPVDVELAKFMQLKFVNFIRTGAPNQKDETEWPAYGSNTQIMKFGGTIHLPNKPDYRAIDDPLPAAKCDFWQKAPFRWPEDEWMSVAPRLREQRPGAHNDLK